MYICTNTHAQRRTHCTTTSATNVHTPIPKEEKLTKSQANEMTLVDIVGELEGEVYTCTHTHAHTHIHTHTYARTCVSANMHIHMYTNTYTYTHVHTH